MKRNALAKQYLSGRAPDPDTRKGRGPGRPSFADGTARTSVFTLKLSDEERAAIETAAKREGETVSSWARGALLSAAKK